MITCMYTGFRLTQIQVCDGSQHVVYLKPWGIHWVPSIFWIGIRSVEYSQILLHISAWYSLFFTQFYYYLSKCNTDTQDVHYNHNLIIIERKTHEKRMSWNGTTGIYLSQAKSYNPFSENMKKTHKNTQHNNQPTHKQTTTTNTISYQQFITALTKNSKAICSLFTYHLIVLRSLLISYGFVGIWW